VSLLGLPQVPGRQDHGQLRFPGYPGAELLFEMLSQLYERGSTMVSSNLPFQEWTEVLGSERLTGALLDRLTYYVHILEMNGDSYSLKQSRRKRGS
jgi:DNA replication protein DnaC